MPSASPTSQWGRRWLAVGAGVRRRVAPGAHDDARLLAADRHAGVGRVGDAQQQLVERRLDLGQVGIEGVDAGAELGRTLRGRPRPPGRSGRRRP